MKEQYDLEDLLKHERSSPLNETVSSETSFPMGCDDQETVNAELNILERKKQGMGASKATVSATGQNRHCLPKLNPYTHGPYQVL
jgi:hypothetical protein